LLIFDHIYFQNNFFKIFPKFVGALELGKTFQIEDSCFRDSSAVANKNDDGTVTVTINLVSSIQLFENGDIVYNQYNDKNPTDGLSCMP
jgi:hypothetical protein